MERPRTATPSVQQPVLPEIVPFNPQQMMPQQPPQQPMPPQGAPMPPQGAAPQQPPPQVM
jgi:hypothetical protein